ncbi:CPCC family cysteine-rich protein [Prosthecobacter sp.]|uniref:CPCC family cysteine-rich protein n=1 Tax=Prosthecobacter sp. TaxID=1965333 RepID=UPI003BB0A6CC
MSPDAAIWYEPADPTPRHQCPCCDYFSLPERGNYLICRICYWEDDGQDLDQLDEESGPNRMTLRQGRKNFLELGACERAMLRHVIPAGQRVVYEHRPRMVA